MTFLEALRAARNENRRNVVVPDIKHISPKEGDLFRGRNPVDVAQSLVEAGAPALSVVTEEGRFGGSMALLREICAGVPVPVLRKDFLNTTDDLDETKVAGASAVLLMYACLPDGKLEELYRYARKIGLDVLVETHTPEEMQKARLLGAHLVGVNNRDIRQLERDDGGVSRTCEMAAYRPEGAFLLSESALTTAKDVEMALAAGADAALVGTAIWQAQDAAGMYRKLCRRVKVKLCGMTDGQGIAVCGSAGADELGFVVEYPEAVPWNLERRKAKELMQIARKYAPVCMVTGGSPEKVTELAAQLMPDRVQLHHRENMQDTEAIVQALKKMGIGVIRTIPCSRTACRAQFGTDDPETLAKQMEKIGVEALLVDARSAENAAQGSGETPVELYKRYKAVSRIPVILAGGITPENVGKLVRETGAQWIDIMTGVEDAPGIKSAERTKQMMIQLGGE